LNALGDRLLPMLEVVASQYRHRTPNGYPKIVDQPERGTIGIYLDPSHALNFMSDGESIFAELTARSSRTDARSSAGRAKFSGMPFNDRRQIAPDVTDQELRNLLSELLSRWNTQPNLIHITDT
jgi:hypothetical protein